MFTRLWVLIQCFYLRVFFLKVLVEKLLRYCDGIDKIYILIRAKKDYSVEERFKKFLESKLFSFAIDIKKIGQKIIPIEGDLSLTRMGLKVIQMLLLKFNCSFEKVLIWETLDSVWFQKFILLLKFKMKQKK